MPSDLSNNTVSSADDSGVSESQFYMWRTLFAITHADDIVSNEETRFMAEAFETVSFSVEQRQTLEQDVREAQDIEEMFEKISDPEDRRQFFEKARTLVHIDGEYGDEEQEIMLKLSRRNVAETDIDKLVGSVDLRLEDDDDDKFF